MAAAPALAVVTDPVQQQEDPRAKHQQLMDWINNPNIAKDLDETLLDKIGGTVVREYDIDVTSRSDWKTKTEQAMEMAMQVAKEKQFPWPKAANVIYPLMTTAAVQFAARAYPAIIQNRSVVKGVVVGDDSGTPMMGPNGQPVVVQGPDGSPQIQWAVPPGAKQLRADNIGEHMSWQLLDEMPEWEGETDTLLHVLPIVGCDFRKTYYDPGKGRNASLRVSAMNLVINYKAKSMETAPRITEEIEYYPIEIEEMERSGLWLKPEQPYGRSNEGQEGDDDAPHLFLEQHRYWDLDEDGYPEPYIVTVHKSSQKVVRIVARYDADGVHISKETHEVAKIDPVHYYTKYDFMPNPDGGIYGVGFGQLLRPINEAVNTTLNQLIDAGTLQNTGGGFIGKGLSMNAGAIRFVMGEYKVVNTTGASLRESIVPMQFPGPSPVLFNLLGLLIECGKEVASVKDVLTGDATNKASMSPTTTLALIEQGLKVFTAIYKRVYRAMKSELNKLYRLNRIYGDQKAEYKVGDTWKQVTKEDYVNGSGVEPIADPNMVSDMQRLGRAQYLMQFGQDPYFNGYEIRHRMLEAANIPNIDKVLNKQAAPNPAIAMKGMELEQKGIQVTSEASERRARELLAYAQAVNQIAQADKIAGDQHLQWLNLQMQAWQKQFEALTTPTPEGQQAPSADAPPPPAMPHPQMVAPTGRMPMPMPGGGVEQPRF